MNIALRSPIRTLNRIPWLWPAIIVLSALAVALVLFWDIQSPLRPAVALWFLLICPGMALVRLMRLGDPLTTVALAIALSLALDGIVAGVMIYAHLWAPAWGLALLIAVSCAGAALQLYQASPRRGRFRYVAPLAGDPDPTLPATRWGS